MIECNTCGYLSHSGFTFNKDGMLQCPNCGSTNLSDDEYGGYGNDDDKYMEE